MTLFFLQVMKGCEAGAAIVLLAEIKDLVAGMVGSGDMVTITRLEYRLLRERIAALSLEIETVIQQLDRIASDL